jgi:hypothetical protein
MAGMETPNAPACSINGEPLFDESLLAATQASQHSHRTGAYTNKEDLMLCEAWLLVGMDPICDAEQKGGLFWQRVGFITMNIGNSIQRTLRVIRMTSPYQSVGASSKRIATILWCPRGRDQGKAKWSWNWQVGKMLYSVCALNSAMDGLGICMTNGHNA